MSNNPENFEIGAQLAEQLDRLFTRTVNRATLEALESGQSGLTLWSHVADMGMADMMVPELDGGAGLGWCSALPVLLALGRHAAPLPLGETMIATAALVAAGLPLPPGPLAVASECFQLDAQDRLSGRSDCVAWARLSTAAVVMAERAGQYYLAVLPRSEAWASVTTFARIPTASLSLQAHAAQALAPAPLGANSLLAPLAVLRAAQIAGSLTTVLAQAVEYANLRVQFGKPIGKQQAIQHYLAELAMQAAAAQVAVQFGCRALDSGDADESVFGAAVAKQRASRAAGIAAAIAHQVFGAIGITEEHILHHHTRRLWQWRAEAGSDHAWAEFLGHRALAAGGHALWPSLVA